MPKSVYNKDMTTTNTTKRREETMTTAISHELNRQVVSCKDGWFHWNGIDYGIRTGLVVLFQFPNGRKAPYMVDDTEQVLEPLGGGNTAGPMDQTDLRYTHGGVVFRQAVEFANDRWR
jgi:hypothetical protein